MKKYTNFVILCIFVFLLSLASIFLIDSYSDNDTNTKITYASIYPANTKLNNKIISLQETYGVNIILNGASIYTSNNYTFVSATSEEPIWDALNQLEDYFLLYNKEFFNHFNKYGMNGLDIYLVAEIFGKTNGFDATTIAGLYTRAADKYVIILNISADVDLKMTAHHETMHAIEDYLSITGVSMSNWDNLNAHYFTYPHKYYINSSYSDVIAQNNKANDIYFIDAYARSSALEDRARTYEYLTSGYSFENYPHIAAKVNYLKTMILKNFPELSYISIYQ